MLAHVVMCDLRPDLDDAARERFSDAIRRAFNGIPSIRRATVASRVTLGMAYERGAELPYDYLAIVEFDDADGLRRYLEHPAHAELASLFWQSCARTLVADYQLGDITAVAPA